MGLLSNDLQFLVDNVLEIDSYKSKMGTDRDIVTLAFSVNGKEPATDLENFIEKGYPFVLDADVTSGEQSDGTYKVFVEIERNKDVGSQIMEIADGVTKLVKNTYQQPVHFEVIDFGKGMEINETINMDHMSEVIWLTKYLGDYNINKYGKDLVLQNEGYVLKLRRIQ
jgi:hypothetical protein